MRTNSPTGPAGPANPVGRAVRPPALGTRGSGTRRGLAFTRGLAVACTLASPACERPIAELEYEIRRALPHDSEAYTQGLLVHDGTFYESTGRYGESEVRRVDIATGRVLAAHALADEHFGEGLALVGDRLVQLTWKAGLAFVYDAATLAPLDTLQYEGEGWGLCHDGRSLFMSDGSSILRRRDPRTFEVLEEIRVTRDGFSVPNLNELECVADHVYANIYLKNEIVRIAKVSGEVDGVLDAYSLSLRGGRPADAGAVFNGIAHDSATGAFYVTGKLWSRMFEVSISEK